MAAATDMDKLKIILQSHIDHGSAVGFAVGVWENGGQQLVSFGLSNANSSAEVTADSIFEIGSISKTFTGILLADMVMRGEVALDDPIGNYLPQGISVPTRNGEEITLRHLASHTSSLPRISDNMPFSDMNNPYVDYTEELTFEFLNGHDLVRDIGSKYEYSNYGMGLLGLLLSRHGGKSYEHLVKERILEPLDMSDTMITINGDDRFVSGHDSMKAVVSQWDFDAAAGAGAIRSSLNDMMVFLRANMGQLDTKLSNAISLSHEQQVTREEAGSHVALGWHTENDGRYIWHNGGTGGFRSFMAFDMDADKGVVVLTNSMADADGIGMAIMSGEIDGLLMEPMIPVENAERYVGEYQLQPGFILTVTTEGEQLFVQATGQPNVPVYFKEKNEFYYKIVDASITFVEGDDGEITSLVLHQGGDHPAKKVK